METIFKFILFNKNTFKQLTGWGFGILMFISIVWGYSYKYPLEKIIINGIVQYQFDAVDKQNNTNHIVVVKWENDENFSLNTINDYELAELTKNKSNTIKKYSYKNDWPSWYVVVSIIFGITFVIAHGLMVIFSVIMIFDYIKVKWHKASKEVESQKKLSKDFMDL